MFTMVHKNENKEEKILEQCLNEMYKKSIPPITWEQIKKKYKGKTDWYTQHKIKENDYLQIKEKYKKKLDKIYWRSFDMELLNYAPTFFLTV